MDYKCVSYNGNKYSVINIISSSLSLPIVIDWDIFIIMRNFNLHYTYNKKGFVVCKNDSNQEFLLHELIMSYQNHSSLDKSIFHLNRIGLDNRRENITFKSKDSFLKNNFVKKKRTTCLPPHSGISLNELPTFIWYMKADSSHGDRFMVNIHGHTWKTTSSKSISLRYKLEEAKAYIRCLKKNNPSLFFNLSMNGDYNVIGYSLALSFYDIIYIAGYTHIKKDMFDDNTDRFLCPRNISPSDLIAIEQHISSYFPLF